MRPMVENVLLAVGCAVMCYVLLTGIYWLDFQLFELLPPNPVGTTLQTTNQSDLDAWFDRVEAQSSRWRFIYLPIVTLLFIAAVGFLSRAWQWTWLIAIVGLSPAAIFFGITISVNPGMAVLSGLVYIIAVAALASILSWYRLSRPVR